MAGLATAREQMAGGGWYLDGPEPQEERRHCARLLERFNAGGADEDDERAAVLGDLLGSVGPGARVVRRFTCSHGAPSG